jgi:glycosyltransferase involved in cell wall biosynthesis
MPRSPEYLRRTRRRHVLPPIVNPFLSVCVMTYNRAATLRETLDSILPQAAELPEVEVLVSDNASADDTERVVRDYCARYPVLRYSRNPQNVGFDGNVIACIENAQGEYVAFCSDDDIAPPGLIAGILKDLVEARPVAAYINHTPFFGDDPNAVSAPTQPVLKKLFTKPNEFYLYTGLGFISALILRRADALKFTGKGRNDRGTAHVDIGSRVVLSSTGPFLFDGTLSVLARHAQNSGYDPLRMGAMNTTRVHQELLQEGLLSQADFDWHNRKTIRLFLQRLIVTNRLKGPKVLVRASELKALYGKDLLFYVYAWPLLIIPAPLLRLIALPLRALMRLRRRSRARRGVIGPAPPHMAPPG